MAYPQGYQQAEPYGEDEYEYARIIDYRAILNTQINDIRRVLNMTVERLNIDTLQCAIDTFESLLSPYDDKKYVADLEALDKKDTAFQKSLNEKEKKQRELDLKRTYYRYKFELLLAKATRRGFTMTKDIRDKL
jgi:hypothetical protein